MNHYQNWKIETDQHNILWLYLDKADSQVNTINNIILEELEQILNNDIDFSITKGLVFASKKTTGFIAGADIESFRDLEHPEEARKFIEKGHHVFNRIASLPIPTLAAIEGFCLGGGFELALACKYRIAENSAKTKLGLPEVLLGIHPGWGGTIRLPALIGSMDALPLILEGRTVDARKAYKLGLVDAEVPKRQFMRACVTTLLNKPASHQPKKLGQLSNHDWVRPILGYFIKQKLAKKIAKTHYPAPFAILENWLKFGADEAGMATEINSLVNLVTHPTTKNLIRVFYLREKMRGLAKDSSFKAKHVHVIGAGTMGGDIAAWCALKGLTVTLQDREPKYIAPAIKRAYQLFKKKLKEDRLVDAAMDRLQPDVEGFGLKHADVIIEAIYENLEAKQNLLKIIEANAKAGAIIASNTSSIPLDEMNIVLNNPERLVGIHYFNPVAKMELVEIVQGAKTSATILKDAAAFVRQIDRSPLPVRSTPGFLVNRVLMPYLLEAVKMIEEGIPGPAIDKAAKDFGMPMGPVELADAVGLDICLSVAQNLSQYYGNEVSQKLKDLVQAGNLGKKSGKGFYLYKGGIPQKVMPKEMNNLDIICDRLIYRMMNEAMACLREGVVENVDFVDAGMIFGTGFAPFRGGPMQYAATIGYQDIHDKLQKLVEQFGDRFTPDTGWLTQVDNKQISKEKEFV